MKTRPKKTLRYDIAILAGGFSSRMGCDKSALLLGGKTVLERVTATARQLNAPVQIVRKDIVPRCGPLGGIYTGLTQTEVEGVLFLSCDMPFVSAALLRQLTVRFERSGKAVFLSNGEKAGFPCIIPVSSLQTIKAQIDSGKHSIQQLQRVLDADLLAQPSSNHLINLNTPADYGKARRLIQREMRAVLSVRGLTIRRGATVLISDFSWSVQPGEHWVILGANGSGKTSLLSALLGYLTPSAGEISLLGQDYGDSDWRALRTKIGVVSSSIRQMMPEAEPAWITVASGRFAMVDFWGTPKKSERATALRILEQIECGEIADRPWAYLSQGERQRILIGRALMSDPAVLILDEPCAGLDPAAREHFLQFLDRLGRKRKAPALVLVTHHVEEIMPVFTHALLLKKGGKTAEGCVSKVLTSQNLSQTFSTPMRVKKIGHRYTLQVKSNPRIIL